MTVFYSLIMNAVSTEYFDGFARSTLASENGVPRRVRTEYLGGGERSTLAGESGVSGRAGENGVPG